MSEKELIEQYVNGAISRRVFMRGLLAAGVSMGAAFAYAETIAPSAAAQSDENFYGYEFSSEGYEYSVETFTYDY